MIVNCSTRADPRFASCPDLTFETSWGDWISSVRVEGSDPRLMMLRRRIRPRGSLRELARMRKVFPPR